MREWGLKNYPDEFKLGHVKAVKFKGKYYKFDYEREPSIVSWMFDSLSQQEAQVHSSEKNPIYMANKFLNAEKSRPNPEEMPTPQGRENTLPVQEPVISGEFG